MDPGPASEREEPVPMRRPVPREPPMAIMETCLALRAFLSLIPSCLPSDPGESSWVSEGEWECDWSRLLEVSTRYVFFSR